jgi:hypothetical protein
MKINEITTVAKYYQDNPDKLQHTRIGSPKGEFRNGLKYSDIAQEQRSKIIKSLIEKLKPLQHITFAKTPFFKSDFFDMRFGRPTMYYSSSWRIKEAFDANNSYDGFLNALAVEAADDPILDNLMRANYTTIYRDIAAVTKTLERISPRRIIQKIATRAGISHSDYSATMDWVEHYTSNSNRKIPKEIFISLQKLTVVPTSLPKYVYRGMFYDGAKIKDKEKFLKKWHEGSSPNVRFPKASSWSVNASTAVDFMDAQDNIKDSANGFSMLLRYEITDPAEVVADMRNLPDGTFWNQQEILVAPGSTNYTVVAMLPYEDYYAAGKSFKDSNLQKFKDTYPGIASGSFGLSLWDMMQGYYFALPKLKISSAIKERWRRYTNVTASDVKKREKVSGRFQLEYEDTFEKLLLPLYFIIGRGNSAIDIMPKEIIDERTFNGEFKFRIKSYFDSETLVLDAIATSMGDPDANDNIASDATIIKRAKVTQMTTTPNNIVINIELMPGWTYNSDDYGHRRNAWHDKLQSKIDTDPELQKAISDKFNEMYIESSMRNTKQLPMLTINWIAV